MSSEHDEDYLTDCPDVCAGCGAIGIGGNVCNVCVDPDDSLDDPMDDGEQPLSPMQFDPLCELQGTPWPNSPLEAASFEYEIAHWRS